ncbi:MAG: hypothetical protein EOP24_35735 [Hyphomicrobiales bacterium]|nr:MAG: hypothetical protein EOP24_35735 [Hyphomicrobiales bacterium]
MTERGKLQPGGLCGLNVLSAVPLTRPQTPSYSVMPIALSSPGSSVTPSMNAADGGSATPTLVLNPHRGTMFLAHLATATGPMTNGLIDIVQGNMDGPFNALINMLAQVRAIALRAIALRA